MHTQFSHQTTAMGLESFETDQPRTTSKKSSLSSSNNNCIHVHSDVSVDHIDIPNSVSQHQAEFIHFDDDTVTICMNCNRMSTSYPAMVKTDHLKFRDKDWYSEFKEHAISSYTEPDTNSSSSRNSKTSASNTNDSTDGDSGGGDGLMSFKS